MTSFDENKSSLNSWKKFYNPGREEVLKLELHSPEKKKKNEKTIEIKKSEGVDMIKLHNSIDRVKKFLPGVLNLLSKSTKEEKAEKILYKRLENIEYENNLKEEISNFNKEIKKCKLIRDEKSEDLIKIDSEINDIELDINMMTDVSRFNMIEKERNDLLKEIQINKEYIKLMKKSSKKLTNSSNNIINNQNDKSNTISTLEINDNSDIKSKQSNNLLSKKNYSEQQLELLFLRASQSLIREMYNLGKEIIMSYLPDFIDEMGIRFIFKQAKIGIELHKLDEQIEKKNELNSIGFFLK